MPFIWTALTDGLYRATLPISGVVGEIIYFLCNLGDAILEPTVRLLIYHASCQHVIPDPSDCYNSTVVTEAEPGVESLSAEYMMFRRLMLGLPVLLIGLFCGSWSDHFGHKLPILIPTLGNMLGVLAYLFCTLNPGKYIALLLIGASLRGMCGRTPIITMATHSYVSEVSSESERTGRLSILQSMNYFGYLGGSFLLGVLLDTTNYSIVFCIVMVVFVLCIPVTIIFMRDMQHGRFAEKTELSEEVKEVRKGSKDRPYWFSFSYVGDSLRVLVTRRECYKRLKLWILFGLMFMTQAWKAGEIEILVLFAERPPYSLTEGHYGYLLATESACMALSTCVVVPILSGVFKVGDICLIIIGTCARLVRLILFIYARNTGMLYLAIILGSPISIAISGLRAQISKIVYRQELNRVFSLLSCVETAASLIGAFIFLGIYTETFPSSNKVTFEVAIAVQVFLVVLLTFLWYMNQRYAEPYEQLDEEDEVSSEANAKQETTQLSTPIEQQKYAAIN